MFGYCWIVLLPGIFFFIVHRARKARLLFNTCAVCVCVCECNSFSFWVWFSNNKCTHYINRCVYSTATANTHKSNDLLHTHIKFCVSLFLSFFPVPINLFQMELCWNESTKLYTYWVNNVLCFLEFIYICNLLYKIYIVSRQMKWNEMNWPISFGSIVCAFRVLFQLMRARVCMCVYMFVFINHIWFISVTNSCNILHKHLKWKIGHVINLTWFQIMFINILSQHIENLIRYFFIFLFEFRAILLFQCWWQLANLFPHLLHNFCIYFSFTYCCYLISIFHSRFWFFVSSFISNFLDNHRIAQFVFCEHSGWVGVRGAAELWVVTMRKIDRSIYYVLRTSDKVLLKFHPNRPLNKRFLVCVSVRVCTTCVFMCACVKRQSFI